jgi:hypothetical protein
MTDDELNAYVRDRAQPQLNWHDSQATRNKKWYIRTQFLTVLAAALVPVATTASASLPKLWISVASGLTLTTALLTGLEGSLHFREQWRNYRTTEQYIARELCLHRTHCGPYESLTPDEAFHLLVQHVEDAIDSSTVNTMNTMTPPGREM